MKRTKGNLPTPTSVLLLPLHDGGGRVGVPGLREAEAPGRGEGEENGSGAQTMQRGGTE